MTGEPGTMEERLADVRRRLALACAARGRAEDEVLVVAVAKGFGPEAVEAAIRAGLRVIGENRVQEAREKIAVCPSSARWHMVGRLQTNKAREAAALFEMIHSVDSTRLLDALSRAMELEGGTKDVLLQVNVAGDSAKAGFSPGDALPAVRAACGMPHIRVRGLMTVPPFTPDPEGARRHFAALRELRDRLAGETGADMPELSMGMSNDYEVAVQEGATMVRLGTALFGARSGGNSWRRRIDAD